MNSFKTLETRKKLSKLPSQRIETQDDQEHTIFTTLEYVVLFEDGPEITICGGCLAQELKQDCFAVLEYKYAVRTEEEKQDNPKSHCDYCGQCTQFRREL